MSSNYQVLKRETAISLVLLMSLFAGGCGNTTVTPGKAIRANGGTAQMSERKEFRSVYPYSLVPGGVTSETEFEAVRDKDELLDKHYGDIGFLHNTASAGDQLLYASYRKRGHIYWTRTPVRVHAGEALLEDRFGNLVRVRCGNRLSAVPQMPVEAVEPPEVGEDIAKVEFVEPTLLPATTPGKDPVLALPAPFMPLDQDKPIELGQGWTVLTSTKLPGADWSAFGLLDQSAAPLVFSRPGGAATYMPTPEPGSWLMLVGAGFVAWGFRWRMRAEGGLYGKK